MITRRQFLHASGAAVAAVGLAPIRSDAPQPARRQTRVLIVGAGVAGLSAAYELDRAGYEVTVFEAKATPGGRVLTVRAPFADGLYAEAGAMYLGDGHDLTMHYVQEFDLPLTPIQFRDFVPSLFHVAGRRLVVRPNEPVDWPVALAAAENGKSVFELQGEYRYSPFRALNLDPGNWPHPQHLEFDDISLADYWRARGASEGAIQLMSLGYLGGAGDGPESLSALSIMHDYAANSTGRNTYQIMGGNDLLPRAFADRLRTKIHYGSPVVAVRQTTDAVEVTVASGSGQHQTTGDFAICAVPFPVLQLIDFQPALPPKRRRAFQEIKSTSVTRIYLQCRERFWENQGTNGAALTDLPIMTVGHATVTQQGVRGILDSYSAGAHARRFGAMTPTERIRSAALDMEKIHPGLAMYLEGGHSVSWDDDPWALGDYAYFQPGQIREFFPYVQEPEGRIYFAGDHIGGQPGYLQSAFISARRAAEEIGARG